MQVHEIRMGQGVIGSMKDNEIAKIRAVITDTLYSCTFICGINKETQEYGAMHYPAEFLLKEFDKNKQQINNPEHEKTVSDMVAWKERLNPDTIHLIFAKSPLAQDTEAKRFVEILTDKLKPPRPRPPKAPAAPEVPVANKDYEDNENFKLAVEYFRDDIVDLLQGADIKQISATPLEDICAVWKFTATEEVTPAMKLEVSAVMKVENNTLETGNANDLGVDVDKAISLANDKQGDYSKGGKTLIIFGKNMEPVMQKKSASATHSAQQAGGWSSDSDSDPSLNQAGSSRQAVGSGSRRQAGGSDSGSSHKVGGLNSDSESDLNSKLKSKMKLR